jgi:L-asparaginase / beta-aspartyl-peptidase
MLVAEGAERYAAAHGIPFCDPAELISPAEQTAWRLCKRTGHQAAHHIPQSHNSQGTVGAVALDIHRSLIAATSTGGTCCKLPGRVGDSPLIGHGCYADSDSGAASATGHGESIMKVVLSKYAVDLLREHEVAKSAKNALALLARKTNHTAGLILLDRKGTPAAARTTPRMAYGYVQADGCFLTEV